MADEAIKTLAVKLALDDGSFQDGIKNLNKSIGVINSEFKASTTGVANWGKSLDGLKANAQALGDKINVQKQIVSAYDEQLKKTQDTFSKNAKNMADLKAKLDASKQSYEQSAASVGKDNDATKKLKEEMDKLQKTYEAAENSVKRNNTATQNYTIKLNDAKASLTNMEADLIKTNAQIDKQSDSLLKVATHAGKAVKELEKIGSKTTGIGEKLSVGITAPIIALGTASEKLASDYTETLNKVDVDFGASAGAVKEWSESTLKNIGLAKGSALDAAATYGDMATSMGFTTGTAAKMAKTIVDLSADMSSFKNIPIAESQTALNAIFTGETESLKKLGIVMTEANLQDYATTQGIKTKVNAMSEQEKVQLRYNYILSVTKNSQGDFARTSESNANQVRELQETAKELGETFGQEVVPAITPMVKGLNETLQAFGSLDSGTKKTIVTVAAIAAAAGPVVVGIGKATEAVGTMGTAFSKVVSKIKDAAAAEAVAGTAAEVAAPKVATLGATIGSIAGPIAIGIAAIAAFGIAYQKSIDDAIEETNKVIDKTYDDAISKNNEELQNNLSNLETEKDKLQSNLLARGKSIDSYYTKLENNLASSKKAQEKALQEENKAYEDAYDQRILLIESEQKAKLANIDQETQKQIKPLQDKIDSIDNQTAAEERAIKDRENAQKESELRAAISSAKNDEDKKTAQKNLDDFLENLDRERLLQERENEKTALQQQIENIKTESEEKKNAVNDEVENQKQLAQQTLDTQKKSVQDRLSALDDYVENAKSRYEQERQNAKESEEKKTSDLIAEINKREQKYQDLADAANKALEAEKKEEEQKTKEEFNEAITHQQIYGDIASGDYAPKGKYGIPVAASGNRDFTGGLIRVNEEGGEIMNLPRHTQIIPHDVSMEMARAAGSSSSNITNIYPATINISLKTNTGAPAGTATIQLTAEQLKQLQNDRTGG